ncbi:hypothetical protein WG66_005255 [Moniliophthora roreri]|uniref:Uncharacterized protein n=1 Tax=Moniliophthora roreri TaxID=221103 RepID=A0A0W0GBS7_MONRR|nr:hypothetical protein WG66_005255 [Moniliophthora roreri]
MCGPGSIPVGSHRLPKRSSRSDATSDSPSSSKRPKSNTESEVVVLNSRPLKTFGRKTRSAIEEVMSSNPIQDVQSLEIKEELITLSSSSSSSASTGLSGSTTAESPTPPNQAPQPACNDSDPTLVPNINPLSRFASMQDETMNFVKAVLVELEETKEKLKNTTELLCDTEGENERLKEKLAQAEEQEQELTSQVIGLTQQVQRTRELEKQVKELQMVATQSKEDLVGFLNGLKGGLPMLERFVHSIAAP